MEDVTVINIMADGTICDDLSKYLTTHDLPDSVIEIIYRMIVRGTEDLE